MTNNKWIVCLCDLTGHFAEPWTHFGYKVLLVDPQHTDFGDGPVIKFPGTVLEAAPFISWLIQGQKVAFVVGWPPCTDVAVSGARWWDEKRTADPYFQAKAALVAEQCRMIGMMADCPWIFENPVSAFSSIFGPPTYKFDPADYAGFCEEDNYTKQTCLWAGGGFIMPPARPCGRLGAPDDRIFQAPPGPERANIRSRTPRGFSIACMLANCLEVRE